uniref:(northern house mosquito) hypothetical protein n=1 Tax=Culex pipiens TaxID=7175 RepID=A0A8D8DAB7_CULPI
MCHIYVQESSFLFLPIVLIVQIVMHQVFSLPLYKVESQILNRKFSKILKNKNCNRICSHLPPFLVRSQSCFTNSQKETNNRNNISLQLVVRLHEKTHTLFRIERNTQIVVCIPNSDIVFTAKNKKNK